MIRRRRDAPEVADVCLILEGTYPFVTGGVSSWVHALIRGLPDVTFALLHISASRAERQEPRYELPDNVVSFAECFVHDPIVHDDPRHRWTPGRARRMWRDIERFHEAEGEARLCPFRRMLEGYAIPGRRVLNTRDLLLSRRTWRYLLRRYEARCPDDSFIDYFWTFRAVHVPLFQIINAETPPARAYHLLSTGYAGLAGVVAKLRTGRPLLLTEHGIYVKERKMEIGRADWIYTEPEKIVSVKTSPGALKEIWIQMFVTLGQLCYAHCDEIFTLFGGNRDLQLELGAPPERLRIVPNGVDVARFKPLREVPRPRDGVRRVGFVGRVVPIKDVKCFIKACKVVADRVPELEVLVLGPTDEDPQYYEECVALVELLGLNEVITFHGRVDVREYFPKLDVFVLTSLSEGQPLTILEAACAGVPTVATDVGSCRELLEGREPEDRAIGPSGIVTGVGDPAETGRALLRLLGDEPLRQRMIRAGYERVERYYRQDQVLDTYREVYRRWTREAPAVARAAAG